MKIKLYYILLALIISTSTGCGLLRSTTKIEARSDSTAVKNTVTTLAEHELLQANIPASYIKSITTPSGMEIELRDSIKTSNRNMKRNNMPAANTEDSTKSVTEPPDLGFISIGFEQSKEQQDSTVIKTEKEQQQSELQETEVETNGSWLTWLLVGIVIALALALAGLLFLN